MPALNNPPPYVQLAQAIGINLLSEDMHKLARFINNAVYLAAKSEREACAKACEDLSMYDEDDPGESYAAAIRKRGRT